MSKNIQPKLRERILTVIKERAKHPEYDAVKTEEIEAAITLVDQLGFTESDLDNFITRIVKRYAAIVENSSKEENISAEEFEEVVYEICLDINHQGIVEQVYFLLRVLGPEEFEKELGESRS